MTPGARLAAAIEVLTEIFARGAAADRVLVAWGRGHRFAGSKDRAAIADRTYTVLRRRNECAYRMGSEGPRALVIGSLSVVDRVDVSAINDLLQDGAHAPGALTAEERSALERELSAPAEPWVLLNYPHWLHDELSEAFGARLEAEIAALNGRAPLDLRVNALRAKRDAVAAELARDGIEAAACRFAPMGLRVSGTDAKITALEAYQTGRVEIQDEASQIAVLLSGAKSGDSVIDLAAGGGGKSLALAAMMQNMGRIVACDVDAARLAPLAVRAERAGAAIIENGGDPYALNVSAGGVDIVFVDAPCSGSGTWRRNPEAKWTLTPERLATYRAAQTQLLDRAVELCSPRGRVVFATCSVLPSEGREQIDAFLARHADWKVKPAVDAWLAQVRHEPPRGLGKTAMLTPAKDGTDGFFCAVLAR